MCDISSLLHVHVRRICNEKNICMLNSTQWQWRKRKFKKISYQWTSPQDNNSSGIRKCSLWLFCCQLQELKGRLIARLTTSLFFGRVWCPCHAEAGLIVNRSKFDWIIFLFNNLIWSIWYMWSWSCKKRREKSICISFPTSFQSQDQLPWMKSVR